MITKRVFTDLAIYMIGFSMLVGIIFPFFVLITGVPSSQVLTPLFFTLCILAGFIVGLFNIFLSSRIVKRKLKTMSFHMKHVENLLLNKMTKDNFDECTDEKCFIKVDSEDEIGESAKAFNSLVNALSKSFKSEQSVRLFSEMLSSRLELNKLAEEALISLLETTEAQGGAIIIEREGELNLLTSSGINEPESILDSDMIWKVFKEEKRLLIDLPEDLILDAVVAKFRPKTVLIEPILYKEVILGAVVLAGIESFSNEILGDMALYNNGLALALKNALTHSQLQKLAARDPLTGILNRRFGLTRLQDELFRSIKNNLSMGILMFDIDHFKNVNDTYGHLVGDMVLKSISQTTKFALREGDIFLRYGGEEFLVILPGASLKDVRTIAEKLRHLVEDTNIQHKDQIIKITISLGGTSYPENDETDANALIEIVDKNMYIAKESGRNMSVIEK